MFVNLKPNRQSLTQRAVLNPDAERGRASAQVVHSQKKAVEKSVKSAFGTRLIFYSSPAGDTRGVRSPLARRGDNRPSLNLQNPWRASSFPIYILQIRD